jgi:hypothetical protein
MTTSPISRQTSRMPFVASALGADFSTRTLYENDEETVFEFIRPQMITGIDELASRGDLLERSLMVELQRIPEDERLTEAELEAKR